MWKASSMRMHGSNNFDKKESLFDYNNMEKIKSSRVRDVTESHLPMEQSDMVQHASYADNSSEIGEWLAQEEASFDRISVNCQKNDLFHENQLAQSPPCLNENFSNIYTSKNNNNQESAPHYNAKSSLPVIRNTELRPTSEIPSPFDSIFKFGVFNVIQSKCIDDAFYENNNLVISAPTGAGKTVLMELAIIRVLLNHGSDSKIIYMAPTKSLCAERVKDWEQKFGPFGIKSKEFTGDTHYALISAIRNTTIIITTPEKWDSMTRRWIDNKQLMQLIRLFLIDEVHILNEKRGACLEACVSRMKTMDINLRYVAVSATVPNLQDIATWLSAKPISFSEEYRPIKLDRFVYGYPQSESNMFLFDKKLNWKLLDLINNHSNGKPTLIFCATRKSAQESCDTISKLMEKRKITSLCENKKIHQHNVKFKDKLLPGLASKGLAFHHAGLDLNDRTQVERLFSERKIRVIATTSTLAVGVNLPAHLVIIKSTQGYQDGSLGEYSDIEILQMIGRAGRPGLDDSGCAVIMTTKPMERRYNALASGTTNLESRLHENLIEHLGSEICLGTISNIESALKWLQSTFLYVRVKKNPSNYNLAGSSFGSTTEAILQEICVKDLKLLEENQLIEKTSDSALIPTQYGRAMDRYYIKFQTMVRILHAGNPHSLRDTLQLVCQSQEELDMIRFNAGDKQILNSLKGHANIKFAVEKVSNVADKLFLIVQCVLGDISLFNLGNSQLAMEATNVMSNISRITKCLIDCSIQDKNAVKLKFALELYQSLQAKMWSTSPYVAKQIEGIGPSHAKSLARANLINMEQLRNCDPGRLEMILHRNPPFGIKLKKHIESIPHFFLNVEQSQSTEKTPPDTNREFVVLHIHIGLLNTHLQKGKFSKSRYAQFWIETGEKDLADFRRILLSKLHQHQQKFKVIVEVSVPNMTIICHLKSEDYVGVDVTKEIKAIVDPRKFISLVGESNAQFSKETKFLTDAIEVDEFNDNNFEVDIDLDLLREMTDDSVASVGKDNFSPLSKTKIESDAAPASTPLLENTVPADASKNEKKTTKKKKNPGELCKHRCKNKETCAHTCCKLHLSSPLPEHSQTTSGIKRTNSTEDEEDDNATGKTNQKRLKSSGEEHLTNRGNSIFKTSQQSVKVNEANSKNHLIEEHAQDDDGELMEVYEFDNNALMECIENMDDLETRLSIVDLKKGDAEDITMGDIRETGSDRTSNQNALYKSDKNSNFNGVHSDKVPISRVSHDRTEFLPSKCIDEWVYNYVKIIENDT